MVHSQFQSLALPTQHGAAVPHAAHHQLDAVPQERHGGGGSWVYPRCYEDIKEDMRRRRRRGTRVPHQQAQGASHTLTYTNYDMNTGVGESRTEGTKAGGNSRGVSHMQVALFQQSLPTAEPKDINDIRPLWSRNDPDVKNATTMAVCLVCMHWWRVTTIFYCHGFSRWIFELVISKYFWVRVEQLTKSRIWFVSRFRLILFYFLNTPVYKVSIWCHYWPFFCSLVLISVFVPVCRFCWL